MSRVVKNSRRCRPRARWKIVAPCMIVLSTSKNAADRAGPAGVAARSPPRRPRPRPRRPGSSALRGSRLRLCRVAAGRRAGRVLGGVHTATLVGAGGDPPRLCETHAVSAHLADLAVPCGRRGPGPARRWWRPARPQRHLGRARRRGRPGRHAASAPLGLVAGYRVVIALGNRTEFVTTYLGVLRAQAGRRTGQPALRRPVSWSGWSPTAAPGWSSPTPPR